MTLQEQFLLSRGRPIHLDGMEVVQMDAVDALEGMITVRFTKASENDGIVLKASKGVAGLENGRLHRSSNSRLSEIPLNKWVDVFPTLLGNAFRCRC